MVGGPPVQTSSTLHVVQIPFNTVRSVVPVADPSGCCFNIKVSTGRVLRVLAEDKAEAADWVRSLTACTRLHSAAFVIQCALRRMMVRHPCMAAAARACCALSLRSSVRVLRQAMKLAARRLVHIRHALERMKQTPINKVRGRFPSRRHVRVSVWSRWRIPRSVGGYRTIRWARRSA
jgi:hypothetical protein